MTLSRGHLLRGAAAMVCLGAVAAFNTAPLPLSPHPLRPTRLGLPPSSSSRPLTIRPSLPLLPQCRSSHPRSAPRHHRAALPPPRKGLALRSSAPDALEGEGGDPNSVMSVVRYLSQEDGVKVFWNGVATEFGLGVLALALGWVLKANTTGAATDSPLAALLLGAAWCLPLVSGLLFTRRFTAFEPFRDVEKLTWTFSQVVFRGRGKPLVALFCLAAGVGEELLFRGLLQQVLTLSIGLWPAIGVTAVVFGLAHCLTSTYFVLAMLASIPLSLAFHFSGNVILVPMVAHALYDFIAVQMALTSPKPAGLEGIEFVIDASTPDAENGVSGSGI